MERSGAGHYIGGLLLALIPITGALSVEAKPRHLIINVLMGIPAMIAIVHGTFISDAAHTGPHALIISAYYFVTTVMIVRHLARIKRVNTELLAGAASIYLLIGLTFALAYSYVASVSPNAFSVNIQQAATGFETVLYFSFVTLTTLGYGDILPVSHVARTLAIFEAILGVMYLGVVVARLVGLYQSQANYDEND